MNMPDAYLSEDVNDSQWRSLCFDKSNQNIAIVVAAIRAVDHIKKRRLVGKNLNVGDYFIVDLIVADFGKVTMDFDTYEAAREWRNRLLTKIENYYGER